MADVRCKDCGLLAVRHADDGMVYPATERTRETAELKMHEFSGAEYPGSRASIVRRRDMLICYVGEPQFNEDSSHSGPLDVIEAYRECESFIHWTPGRHPEQHLAMRELQEQRDHNARMLKEEQRWRESQAQAERDWRDMDRKDRAKEATEVETRFWLGLACTAGAMALAQIIGQVLAALLRPPR